MHTHKLPLKTVKKVEHFSKTGLKTINQAIEMNEDRIFIDDNLFAVIDGATSSSGVKINGLSDGAYIAEFIVNYIKNSQNDNNLKAVDILSAANKAFGIHLKNEYPEIYALGKQGPCASGVIVKLHNDNSYSFAQVGDCMLIEKNIDCLNELTIDNRYDDDNYYLEKANKTAKSNDLSIFEIRTNPQILNYIKEHRKKSNVSKGVLTGEEAMDKFIVQGQNKLNGTKALVLMSDGMAHPEYKLKQTYKKAAEYMLNLSIEEYYNELKNIFDADNDFKSLKYLRFKHLDDASAIVINF